MNSRQNSNLEIVNLLIDYLIKNPNQRFGQALMNLNVLPRQENSELADPFYEEPEKTLERIQNTLKLIKTA